MDLHVLTDQTAWFGRRPPPDLPVVAAFGARAILTGRGRNQFIDILPDRRQAWTADTGIVTDFSALPPDFRTFLHHDLASWLQRRCDRGSIEAGSFMVFTMAKSGRFFAEASAQASYGYLYVGAWMLRPPETGSS